MIPTWHLFYALAAVSCLYAAKKMNSLQASPLDLEHIHSIFVLGYVSSYFGARIWSAVFEENLRGLNLVTALLEFGPMGFFGGFLGGGLALVLWCLHKKIPKLHTFNIVLPVLCLGLGIGRIGCFFNGDDYGVPVFSNDPVALFFSASFANHPHPIPRIPVQLIEAFGALTIFLFVWRGFKKKINFVFQHSGVLALGSYGFLRFLDEFWRGDERGGLYLNLSPGQWMSLGLLTFSLIYILTYKFWAYLDRFPDSR